MNTNMYIGNYRVIRELARGASGQVYLAQHVHLTNRIVAIKLLHMAFLSSQQERDSFLKEARFLELLKHPYILPVYDVGMQDGFPYFVVEYAPNGSLKERFQTIAPERLPPEEVLGILWQIGQALQFAHQHNIIHRDIKPANILFNTNGDAVLADFSIALRLEMTGTQRADSSGTPYYMAPEQFEGIVSKKSDQYALGCVAYELVTGQRPFTALDWRALAFKHANEEPIPPSQFVPQLPQHIEAAILKAMAKDRTNRHEDVAAFISALGLSAGAQGYRPPVSQTNIPTARSVSNPRTRTQTDIPAISQSNFPTALPTTPWPEVIPLESTPHARTPVLPPTQEPLPVAVVDGQKLASPIADLSAMPALSDEGNIPTVVGKLGESAGGATLRQPGDRYIVTPSGMPTELRQEKKPVAGAVPPSVPGTTDDTIRQGRFPKGLLPVVVFVLTLLLISGGVLFVMAKVDFNTPSSTGAPSPSTSSSSVHAPTASVVSPTTTSSSGAATVTIVPVSKNLQKTYTVSVSGQQVSGTSSGSQTVNATGQHTTPATNASGSLTFDNPNSYAFSIPAGSRYQGNSGVTVATAGAVTVPANGSVSVSAYATQAGTNGNIPAYDLNNALYYVPGHNGEVYRVSNPAAFSGGANGQSYTFVQQSDVNGAENALTGNLTPGAQQNVQAQVSSNEQLIGGISCNPTVTAINPPVGTKANSVTVTVSVNCNAEEYEPLAAQTTASTQASASFQKDLGANYALVGSVQTTVGSASLGSGGTINIPVTAEGKAVYHFSNLASLARSIAGKNEQDAHALLLKQQGVQDATIQISGNGDVLSTDPNNIKITVAKVSS
jgi:serine/threonine protein kinase